MVISYRQKTLFLVAKQTTIYSHSNGSSRVRWDVISSNRHAILRYAEAYMR